VVPLGVDTDIYKPGDKSAARKKLGIAPVKDTDFIVCNVNRNQNRKRIDLTILYFAEWIRTRKIRTRTSTCTCCRAARREWTAISSRPTAGFRAS
jgi:hypothetical protein